MLAFENDYSHGCHPALLQRLAETNLEPLTGYGQDGYTRSAAEKIRDACGCPEAEVYFIFGGTQTNQLVIDTMLPSWGAVLSCETGHIGTHESGAVEFTGHKVVTLPAHDGKLDAAEADRYLTDLKENNGYGQLAEPALVYISFPTEFGTLYSKEELRALRAVCDRHAIGLYLDGARLGYGLASPACDVTLPELAALCDAFYIGGTKVGALCGEAVVFPRHAPAHFYASMKQHGAMQAKGRLIGVQFDRLFTDGLYLDLSRRAIEMAELLKQAVTEAGLRLDPVSPTNQQFAVMTRAQMQWLQARDVKLLYWDTRPDGNVTVRLTTSWATAPEDIAALGALLREMPG